MSARRVHAYILLLIVALIWGVASSVIKFTQQGIPTLPFLTYRFAISALIALVFFVMQRKRLVKNLFDLVELTVYGLLVSSVSLGLLFLGLEKTTVVESELITATSPLIVSLMGFYLLREHVTAREKFGSLIAFAGTVFIILEPLLNNGTHGINVLGNVLIFLYVLANAVASIIGKKLLRKGVSPSTLTNFGFVVGFLSVAALTLYNGALSSTVNEVVTLEPQYHLGVLYMAILSGTLAYTLGNQAQKTIEVGEAAVFTYLIPVFGIPVAMLWLKETITPRILLGAAIIAIGVFIAEVKKKRYN